MKNIKYVIHNEKGRILSFGECLENVIEFQNVPDGCTLIENAEGHWDTHYVDNGVVVKKSIRPNENSVFNYATKSWELDSAYAIKKVLMLRNNILAQSDWTQLSDVPLETKQAWAAYRQQLRDVTSQSGYPFNVIWPMPPQG